MGLIFHNLISFDDAFDTIKNNIKKIDDYEDIDVSDSTGRITVDDIYSTNNLPLFSRSQVDGYAVISDDIKTADYNNPVKLIMSGETYIGESGVKHPGNGRCIKVPTGGVIPVGADAMVPFEDTKEDGGKIIFFKSVPKFNEISNPGIDVVKGERIINRYTVINTGHISVLSSVGIKKIRVFRKIRIGVISTGNELLNPGDPYTDGKIYESNSMAIKAEMSKYSALSVKSYGIIKDDYNSIKNIIDRSVNENDITVTVGSTSAGDHDMVYKIFDGYEPGIIFHGVRVKPGKHFVFAKNNDKILFGLPGFPVSSMMILYSLVIPNLFNMLNYEYNTFNVNATTGERFKLHSGSTDLLLIKLLNRNNNYYAYQVHGNSGSISRIMKATGFSIIDSKSDYLKEGEKINVNIFSYTIPEILIYGEYSPLMEKIPYNIMNKAIFVESNYSNISVSMEKNEGDLYITNSEIKNDDYLEFKFNIPLVLIFNRKDYRSVAVLYKGTGLYNYSIKNIKSDNITYLDNTDVICDYVRNNRCDAGIVYLSDALKYSMNYDAVDNIPFYFYLYKQSKYFNEIKLFFDDINDSNNIR